MFRKSVDQIVAGLSDMVSNLETRATQNAEQVTQLNAQVITLESEGQRAAKIAAKIKEIIE